MKKYLILFSILCLTNAVYASPKDIFVCEGNPTKVAVSNAGKQGYRYTQWTTSHSRPSLVLYSKQMRVEGEGACAYQVYSFARPNGWLNEVYVFNHKEKCAEVKGWVVVTVYERDISELDCQ